MLYCNFNPVRNWNGFVLRNTISKYFAANNTFDAHTLEVYNEQLTNYGSVIYSKRKKFIELFNTIFLNRHKIVSGAMDRRRQVALGIIEKD